MFQKITKIMILKTKNDKKFLECQLFPASSPYWLNCTLLPDLRPTAGKCQADSREQSAVQLVR